MDSTFISIVLFISIGHFLTFVQGECSGNVGRCEWTPWSGWSDCSRECAGGTQRRDRRFCCKSYLADNIALCMKDCGMDYSVHRSGFYDSKECNSFCYNGGKNTFPGYCHCLDRYKGTCCRNVVTCGQPSTVSHGKFYGNDFTYNGQVRYECDKDYNMTDPSKAIRTCTKHEYWTGSSPICLYVMSCNSSPCINGGSCTNLLGDNRCICNTGWTGKTCETDLFPNSKSGTVTTCTSESDKQDLAATYIDRLKASKFNDLCQRHLSDCIHENVIVAC